MEIGFLIFLVQELKVTDLIVINKTSIMINSLNLIVVVLLHECTDLCTLMWIS